MKLGVTLDILNQKDTPAFYADTLANRPAAGFTGRVFISTDTLDLYRDTGTTWVLLSPSSTGTITGSGAAGQVSYFSGASSIAGSNDLFFDSVNGHLGIGTITPSTALTIFHDQNQIIQINQTTATNDTKIAFQNSGTPLWRIGNSYGAGTNRFVITDATLNINRFSVLPSSGQTFVGDVVTSSGLFVVNSSSSDAHIVALGATAPSIRVRNAGTGASLQIGLGLATTTNNFIQGSVGGEFCIFNDSLTAQPILFGIKDAGSGNTLEAARISAARNFLVGTTTDAGQKFQVIGTTRLQGNVTVSGQSVTSISPSTITGGTTTFSVISNGGTHIACAENGVTALGSTNGSRLISFFSNTFLFGAGSLSSFNRDGGYTPQNITNTFGLAINANYTNAGAGATSEGSLYQYQGNTATTIGNVTLNQISMKPTYNNTGGTTINRGLFYNPTLTSLTGTSHRAIETVTGDVVIGSTSGNLLIGTATSGASKLRIVGLPTSAAGLSSGDVYSNLGILTIVP